MDELRKKLENLKENFKNIDKQIKQLNLKKNVEEILMKNKKEKENYNDILFLIQYSLKYKNVCKWPNYNNLFVINYNINDNFKSIVQKYVKNVQQHKSFTPIQKEDNILMHNNEKKGSINTDINDTTKNAPHSRENIINDNISKDMSNDYNKLNTTTNNGSNNETVITYISEQNKTKNLESINTYQKKKEKKINTQYNDDISSYDKLKLQIFMYFVLNNYRVKILIDSLSALNRPINIIYINCPNNKEQKKKTFIDNIANIFSTHHEVNDVFINNKNNFSKDGRKNCSCSELPSARYNNPSITQTKQKKKKSNYAGGYNPISNTIWLCANNITNFYKLKYILTHELIHAFDFARANIDTYNCYHIACSEIRAYNMSNQCSYFNSKYFSADHDVFSYLKSPTISDTPKNKCIYNNVHSSLYQYKPCANDTYKYINHVFEKCTRDYWPFMCAPEQDSKYKPSKIFKRDN
ncbi:metalloprotease, putative [Plasmodium malariae]|uniref:Metalloprotease, putative n=1 Tax=Plasmodium malariae TaxID=5858 RepID=A0A1C3L1U8_PLAMA|nr:metalloprotease, putative [Plasmodium malariae]